MTHTSTAPFYAAAKAFDSVADDYDRIFTRSVIGIAQRSAVWRVLERTFKPGSYILELNCGTGEDAFFLSRMGVRVHACDVSERMIAVARQRQAREAPHSAVEFSLLANERMTELNGSLHFDGILSNFGGLNCVDDLGELGVCLSRLAKPGSRAVLCFCSRACIWEIAWFLCHGKPGRAFRRTTGCTTATVNGVMVEVKYPTVRHICRALRPWFELRELIGVGITVPPTYLECWAQAHRQTIDVLSCIDRNLSGCPGVRALGDHVLVVMERTDS